MKPLLTQRLESVEHMSRMRPGQWEGKEGMKTQKSGWMLGENCLKDGHGCLQPLAGPYSLLQPIGSLQA